MSKLKKKKDQPKTSHKFPHQDIIDHVEYEGNGMLLLADRSDSSKMEVINSFGAEAKIVYDALDKRIKTVSDKLKVKATFKVFIILE
jgi:hypothetical protein